MQDREQLWLIPHFNGNSHLGSIVVHQCDAVSGKVYDATYTIDEKWLIDAPVFTTWDFKKKRFSILD